ncbi:MAG: class I SAM-dependent methyltransferase [Anaerolineae bacterium]
MRYLSLSQRVPEACAVEPQALTWLYGLYTSLPFVRTVYGRFVSGALAQRVTHGQALDLGTGPGYVALELARQAPGLRVIGVDLAAHMVEQAQRQAKWMGLAGRGLWPQGDAHCLPFPDGSVDLVVSSFAMHHWQEPLQVLNEIARVLKPSRPGSKGSGQASGSMAGGRYFIADLCREVTQLQRLFAYGSIPAVSIPFGSYWGYGGYYESVRAGYTCQEAQELLDRSNLPPGEVHVAATWFVPILVLAPKEGDKGLVSPDRREQ